MQVTYTSKLPDTLLKELELVAAKLKTSKKDVIAAALTHYFEELKKAEYIASFKKAKGEPEIIEMAEEGFGDYSKLRLKNSSD
ncbi:MULTISPECIES: CopG family transcriptional regulator [unclassified Dyadobacter]|uniref:CopG family transcriptional regulator n=1 Tax=unclassified Dyadobacter TaxID=2625061 RepID=UPI001F16F0E9|nr:MULTISPECIES: CopG family transcriptional regulator [unclassified Dyadobacter]MCF0059531.1 CopG family transcriptional regulator [Dyadobacter sp. CY356]MCF2445133.1 CopG family transcriptional regulator [Dyadobacter sp. CY345]